jgi:hypothetical protein
METMKNSGRPRPVITQTLNNTTLWVGHLQNDPTDHFAGQTFSCPAEGQLDNIQIFSSAVQHPGEMVLSLHAFDPSNKTWGPAIVSSSVEVNKKDEAKWIQFQLASVPLEKGKTYGFRLHTKNAMVAIGEAAAGTRNPFEGQEWHGNSSDQKGQYFTYFSLAYKIEICA